MTSHSCMRSWQATAHEILTCVSWLTWCHEKTWRKWCVVKHMLTGRIRATAYVCCPLGHVDHPKLPNYQAGLLTCTIVWGPHSRYPSWISPDSGTVLSGTRVETVVSATQPMPRYKQLLLTQPVTLNTTPMTSLRTPTDRWCRLVMLTPHFKMTFGSIHLHGSTLSWHATSDPLNKSGQHVVHINIYFIDSTENGDINNRHQLINIIFCSNLSLDSFTSE